MPAGVIFEMGRNKAGEICVRSGFILCCGIAVGIGVMAGMALFLNLM